MEFEGDSPAPRPPAPPEPSNTQNLSVDPEHVVALATVFRACAERLQAELSSAKEVARLFPHWMDDPISEWVEHRFMEFFARGDTALLTVLQGLYGQYEAATEELVSIGARYDLTEELNAAGFVHIGAPK